MDNCITAKEVFKLPVEIDILGKGNIKNFILTNGTYIWTSDSKEALIKYAKENLALKLGFFVIAQKDTVIESSFSIQVK